eukprot:sb/3467797/
MGHVRELRKETEEDTRNGGALGETLKSLLFVLGTAVLATIAVRNSVNPYIHKIWGASHDFWGELWDRIYDLFGRNDHLVHHLGSAISYTACFVVFNAVFLFCDITGKPSWLLKYKVQEGKNEPVDQKKLWSCIRTSAFNLLIVSPVVTLVLYPMALALGSYHKGQLPTFERLLLEFVVFTLVEEVLFYYSHRYALVIFSTTLAHGGYHVPFLFSPEAHDYHHKTFNCWFGTVGILDKLHKTDKPFCGSIQEVRHYVSFSLTPVKEIHPDPKDRLATTSCTKVE